MSVIAKMSTEKRNDFQESALSAIEYAQKDLERITSLIEKAPIESDEYEKIMLNILKAFHTNLAIQMTDVQSLINMV
jgi:hypothetical protein